MHQIVWVGGGVVAEDGGQRRRPAQLAHLADGGLQILDEEDDEA